jgi:hypothetical protein
MMRSRGRLRLARFGLCATGALLGAVTLPATAGAAVAPGAFGYAVARRRRTRFVA